MELMLMMLLIPMLIRRLMTISLTIPMTLSTPYHSCHKSHNLPEPSCHSPRVFKVLRVLFPLLDPDDDGDDDDDDDE